MFVGVRLDCHDCWQAHSDDASGCPLNRAWIYPAVDTCTPPCNCYERETACLFGSCLRLNFPDPMAAATFNQNKIVSLLGSL